MATKKIITVFGATGKQGGAIVNTFVSDPKLREGWAVRGITRDVSKPSAQALAAKGVDVVTANMDDKSSLVKAVAGSYAVFAVTDYWQTMNKELEIQQGKNIVDAVKETNVQHFIWSSLLNITKLTNGKLSKVYHFDSKAEVEAYARSLNVPATFFMPGFYLPNLDGGTIRQTTPGDDTAFTFSLPGPSDAPIPVFDPADTGKYVKAIALGRESLLGERVYASSGYMTPDEIVAGIRARFPGVAASFYSMPHEQYLAVIGAAMGPHVAEELLQNMRLFAEGGYFGGASLDGTAKLVESVGEKLTTWDEFMGKMKIFEGLQ